MKNIEAIAETIKQNGGRLYLVGGAIRDRMLGLPEQDEDYCVTGISIEKFKKIFKNAKIQGKDFPVFIIGSNEFALARRESKCGKGHSEFKVDANTNISITEDLGRRDITINSIAQDVLTKEIIDPYKGINDLRKGVIRKTSDAFKEDPLRAYRVARFAANFEFEIEKETFKDMQFLKNELIYLPKERVYQEFKKSLETKKPSFFFEVLRKADLLSIHFREIYDLIDNSQLENKVGKLDYYYTMNAIDKATQLTDKLEYRFSVLTCKLENEELIEELGSRLGVPKKWIKAAKVANKWYKKAVKFKNISPTEKIEMIESVEKSILGLEGLKIIVTCFQNKKTEEILDTYNQIVFDIIGKDCLKQINGCLIVKECPNFKGKEIYKEIHKRRMNWIKLIDTNNYIKYNKKKEKK